MKNPEISLTNRNNSYLLSDQIKNKCEKCGGSGNLKTPDNGRRTCLMCFGRGFR
tara:strand:+ start:228 stop:389 length:162 start_codon:yes stop_codon:yes gene_type:complete